ncbi:MAG: polymer-forming cytoskeletal protein [Candidatus Accumulibacter sp.]|jgi:cytoskeletal protein CcmA (bactofilin family)|nr:polymer-forming cytoskeletal protein [Accumulibacter sp.]
MFGSKKGGAPQDSIDSLISAGTRIEGNIVFSGGLRIDGEVRGNICSTDIEEGTLVISEKASVEGGISVGHIVLNGTIVGPVCAGESLELLPSARVTGDVEYHQIEMHQGAVIQGRMVHQANAKSVELKLASGG